MDAQHVRDVGTIQIAVQDADAKAHRRQRQRQADGDGRFADAAFAAQHRQHVPLLAEAVAAAKHPSAAADLDFEHLAQRVLQVGVQPRQLLARHVLGGQHNRQPALVDQNAGDLRIGDDWRAVGIDERRDERSNARFVHAPDDRAWPRPPVIPAPPSARGRGQEEARGWWPPLDKDAPRR